VHIIVHNCRTQRSTEQFRLLSLLASRQSSQLRCCLVSWGSNSDRVGYYIPWQFPDCPAPNQTCRPDDSKTPVYSAAVAQSWPLCHHSWNYKLESAARCLVTIHTGQHQPTDSHSNMSQTSIHCLAKRNLNRQQQMNEQYKQTPVTAFTIFTAGQVICLLSRNITISFLVQKFPSSSLNYLQNAALM